MRPTLSVIVPVYNAERYISECIDSILPQLWNGCKLILIDDGSTDNSYQICQTYAIQNTNISILKITHAGLAEARNIGLQNINTDYIAFCDADDKYMPGALIALSEILDKETKCDIAIGQFKQSEYNHRPITKIDYEIVSSKEAIIHTLYQDRNHHNGVWAKIYRSKIFKNIRFISGRYYEDLEILPRIYHESEYIAVSDATIYYYRPNPTSFINTWSDSRADAVYAAKNILNYITDNYPDAIAAAHSRLFSAAFNIFNLASKYKQPKLAYECWDIIKNLRKKILVDPNVRIKNKIGAILSYLGKQFCSQIARIEKKR